MKMGDSLGRSRRRRKKKPAAESAGITSDGSTPSTEDAGPPSSTEPAAPTSSAERAESSPAGDVDATKTDSSGTRGIPGRGGLRGWLKGRNLLMAVVGVCFVGWFFGYGLATQIFFPAPPPPGDLFEVPNLRGLGIASASERLAGAGLDLGTIDSLQHPAVAAGLVLGQSPLPTQVALPDTRVHVTISTGPQMRSVPDVLRLDEARARVVLESSGFVVSVDTTEAEEARGRVVGVTPPPDSVVPLPAQVRLLISTGPPLVPMPFVLGLEQAEAEALLDSLGLAIAGVEEVFRFGLDQGIVVEQEPAADTELRRGGTVRLKVGRRGLEWEQ